MKSTSLFLWSIALFTFSFLSCKKENSLNENDAESLLSQRQMEFVQSEIEDVEEYTESEMPTNGLTVERLDSLPDGQCVSRTWSGDSLQRILTIDYGTSPCLCLDSIFRSGKIRIVFEGKRHVVGATKTIYFLDYNVDNRLLNGKVETVYIGNAVFKRKIVEMSMQFEDRISNWKGEETIKILAGFETPSRLDNVKSVIGRTWGVNLNGINYRREITQALIRKNDCSRFFIDGKIQTNNERGNSTLLNFNPYDDMACDNLASISLNGNEPQIITLKHRIR
jgi:hypothetical protein